MFRIQVFSLITHSMKMRTRRICINFQLETSCPVFLKTGSSRVLHMVKQAQVKLSQLTLSQSMRSMTSSKLLKIKQDLKFICRCTKFTEENAWIYLTTRKNCRFLRTKIIKSKFMAWRSEKLGQLARCSRL